MRSGTRNPDWVQSRWAVMISLGKAPFRASYTSLGVGTTFPFIININTLYCIGPSMTNFGYSNALLLVLEVCPDHRHKGGWISGPPYQSNASHPRESYGLQVVFFAGVVISRVNCNKNREKNVTFKQRLKNNQIDRNE